MAPSFTAAASCQDGDLSGALEPVFARDDPFVVHAVHTLHNLAQLREANSRVYGETLGMAVAAHVVKQYGVPRRTAPAPLPLDRFALQRIDEFIEKYLHTNVSVAELAALVNMGVFRFSRLLKVATGKPPHQYVLHKRIERAKSILAGQPLSISDVAGLCGSYSRKLWIRSV